MSHTPGPWIVDPKRSLRVVAEHDNTVCTVGCTDSLRSSWEDNARLIAAAPELLEACKFALTFFKAQGWGRSDAMVKECEEIGRAHV